PRSREEAAEKVVMDLAPVLHDVVEARADQSAEQRSEDALVRPVLWQPELGQAPQPDGAGRDEPDPEADAERLTRDRAKMDLRKHAQLYSRFSPRSRI